MYVPSSAPAETAPVASSSTPAPEGGSVAGWLLLSTGPLLLIAINSAWLFAGVDFIRSMPTLSFTLLAAAFGCMIWGGILTSRSRAGVGGWLIPIGLLSVLRAFGHGASLATLANSYASNLASSNESATIMWTFLGHGTKETALLILALATAILLARRSRRFPAVCSLWLGLSILLGAIETGWLFYLGTLGYFVDPNMFADAESLTVVSLIAFGAFGLYRRRSQRVRETFVR
jgi:hypothetical protein